MKKIERIQIAGHSFFFEDDAFVMLENFIKHIHQLYNDDCEAMKVAEVENRIAEMCHERVGEDGIVTAVIVDEIISAVGIKVEESAETVADGDTVKNDEEQNATWYKAMLKGSKLFRDNHGNYLGGVLSGFAMYYDVDVTVLRVITLVMFILPLQIPVMLAYIILWAVLPKAVTIMDYTRMRRVKGCGDNEAVRQEWRNNYERCVAELSVPAGKGCLYSLVRILFFILAAFLIMPLAVVIFVLLLALLVLVVAGWGMFEAFNIPFMMTVGIVAVIVIPIFLLVWLLLEKMNVGKPMKRRTRKLLSALWVILLLCVMPVAHRYIKEHGGYGNIVNIIEYHWESIQTCFGGDIKDIALMTGNMSYSSGSLYNTRHIDSCCDAVFASTWDAKRGNDALPLIIESVHDSGGGYTVTFYTHGDGFLDTQDKLVGEDYDARISMQFLPGDEVNGWHCFAWDSISRTVYYGEFSFGTDECMLQRVKCEELSSKIKLHTMESLDGVSYENAAENGLVPFKIFYYGHHPTPSLVVGHDETDVKEVATTVRLRGRYNAKYGKRLERDLHINRDAAEEIDGHINGIFDATKGIIDASLKIVDVSSKVVGASNEMVEEIVEIQKDMIDVQKDLIKNCSE